MGVPDAVWSRELQCDGHRCHSTKLSVDWAMSSYLCRCVLWPIVTKQTPWTMALQHHPCALDITVTTALIHWRIFLYKQMMLAHWITLWCIFHPIGSHVLDYTTVNLLTMNNKHISRLRLFYLVRKKYQLRLSPMGFARITIKHFCCCFIYTNFAWILYTFVDRLMVFFKTTICFCLIVA